MTNQRTMPMLAVLYGSAFAAAFNENIVNVALISIMGEFDVSAGTAQWLVTGYMIVTAVVVTVTAFLSNRLRLRTLFFLASALLAGGSIAALASPTFASLLIARLVQSVGTGIFIPMMMSTVLAVAPRKRMGTFLSIGGCMITFGPAFAPVVSGLMVTSFGWRSVFVPPLVIVALLAAAGAALVRNIAEPEDVKLDVPSVVLSAVGLSALVFGLSIVMSNPPLAVGALVAGIACVGVFYRRQHRVPNPLLNLQPLHNPKFAPVCLLVIVAMMTTFSMSVLLPLYFEGAVGTSAFAAGALLLPPILVNAGTSLAGGRIMDKHGSWPLLPAGFAVIAVGQIAVCALALQMSQALVLAAAVVVYAGVGLVFSPSQTAGLQTLPGDQHPHGVAIINTFVQVAASIGPSLLIGILSSVSAGAQVRGTQAALAQAEGFMAAVAVAAAIAVAGCATAFVYARNRAAADAAEQPAESPSETRELTVADVVREPYLVRESATVRDVMRNLVERRTSGLPVVDEEDRIVGFVTDGDVLAALSRQNPTGIDLTASLAVYRDMRGFDDRFAEALDENVMDIATANVVSVNADTSLDDVCAILSTKRIKKVPVLDDRRVVGTISRSDVVRALMQPFAEGGRSR